MEEILAEMSMIDLLSEIEGRAKMAEDSYCFTWDDDKTFVSDIERLEQYLKEIRKRIDSGVF